MLGSGKCKKWPRAVALLLDDLLKRADGKYPNGGPQEGIVIRPATPVYSDLLGADLSMKVINNKYLGE